MPKVRLVIDGKLFVVFYKPEHTISWLITEAERRYASTKKIKVRELRMKSAEEEAVFSASSGTTLVSAAFNSEDEVEVVYDLDTSRAKAVVRDSNIVVNQGAGGYHAGLNDLKDDDFMD
mmetsp:Transcript_7454/g.18818  ORF Transcript_7454/g.18818 Transcript_7454/m.18818 type:complete len:119 (+) Transcript_7454:94-450(+)